MSGLDFSGLGDLAKGTVKAKGEWEPLTLTRLAPGHVLALDQSLTATGWVYLRVEGGNCFVANAGKFGGGFDDLTRGVEQDLQRGNLIYDKNQAGVMASDLRYVHESPPHAGNVKGGGTSSLMAAQSVRNAASNVGVGITMLGAQPAKRLICGNANARKPEAHAALKQHCFPWIFGVDLVTNEATRDALMLALLHLARKKTGDV